MDEDKINEMREKMQKALIDAKRQKLQDDFGMVSDQSDSKLSLDVENEWLDHLLNFEAQFANAKFVTVWERMGKPEIKHISDILTTDLENEVEALIELLHDHMIVVDFLGTWTPEAMYFWLVDELLEEEIEEKPISGMFTHFNPASADYEMLFWVDDLCDYLLSPDGLKNEFNTYRNRTFTNRNGESFTFAALWHAARSVWGDVLEDELSLAIIKFKVSCRDGARVGQIDVDFSWARDGNQEKMTSSFELVDWGDYWQVESSSLLVDLQNFDAGSVN